MIIISIRTSDVIPIADCPDDFIDYFLKELKAHPFARKIGFSLRIDNLPDQYEHKQKVIDWEKQYYARPTRKRFIPGSHRYDFRPLPTACRTEQKPVG